MTDKSTHMPTVSIICSAYNVEQYIDRCLASLSAQTMTDWECIVIDDGSPDRSGVIADEFAASDPRFRVIHQTNGGISMARNRAIENARGRYIMFVDPDDWVEPDYIKCLYETIESTGADVVQCGFFREYDGITRTKPLFAKETILSGREAMSELLLDRRVPSYLWNKIFKSEVVRPNFPEGKTFEDIDAMSEWFERVDKMVCLPDTLYHYRVRRGSVLNSDYGRNRYNYVDVCHRRADRVMDFMGDLFNQYRHDAYVYKTAVGGAKAIARLEPSRQERQRYVGMISKDIAEVKLPPLKYMSLKLRLRGWLLRQYPGVFIRLMRAVYLLDFQMRHRSHHIYE